MKNLPSLAEVADDPSCAVGLPLDAIEALLADCETYRKTAEAAKRALTGHLHGRFGAQIDFAFRAQGKDYGTVHIAAEGYSIAVNREKKVAWDQMGLLAIRNGIFHAGENADDYVTVEYKVPEAKYAAWPEAIRKQFDAHRTTKPGSLSFKLTAA